MIVKICQNGKMREVETRELNLDIPETPEPEPTPEERLSKVEKRTDTLESTTDDMILLMADLIGGM